MQKHRGFTLVELLVVIAIIALLVAILIPAVQSARAATRRVHCSNNLRQLALATLNYESANNGLPSVIDSRLKSMSLHGGSWRVSILPFVEQSAEYEAFKDATSWDVQYEQDAVASSNPLTVELYQCPSSPGYPAFDPRVKVLRESNRRMLFDGVGVENVVAPWRILFTNHDGRNHLLCGAWLSTKNCGNGGNHRQAAKIQWIVDGLSQTILIGEQSGAPNRFRGGVTSDRITGKVDSNFLIWNNSDDPLIIRGAVPAINYDNADGLMGFHGGAHAAFCDGAIKLLSADTSPAIVAGRLARNDSGRLE